MDINYIKLCQIKKEIENLTKDAESIIKMHFPEEHQICISFWMPQIITALGESDKWLSRGDYSMQKTLDKIKSSLEDD